MILIKAIATCDTVGCKNKIEIEYGVTADDRNILEFELQGYHEGWYFSLKQDNYRSSSGPCTCPDHTYYYQEELKRKKLNKR